MKILAAVIAIFLQQVAFGQSNESNLKKSLAVQIAKTTELERQIKGAAEGQKQAMFTAICHGGLSNSESKGVIVRYYVPGKSIQTTCQEINGTWHACGVAKPNFHYQDCESAAIDRKVFDWGYTSFVRTKTAQANIDAGSYKTCTGENMAVCCSPSCSGW